VEDPVSSSPHEIEQLTGVYSYGFFAGPAKVGASEPPVHVHSAAHAVLTGLSALIASCSGELLRVDGREVRFMATTEPLVLLRAPLTVLTATSDPEGSNDSAEGSSCLHPTEATRAARVSDVVTSVSLGMETSEKGDETRGAA
jgi:hypothetical protein